MKSRYALALPLLAAIVGCSESATDSGASGSNPEPVAASLAQWAPSANIVLAGDAVVEIPGLASRWDSVANLARYQSDARKDLQKIFADWASRKPKANDWEIMDTVASSGAVPGNTYLVAFSVDGVEQGGLVWIPATTGPTPVVLFGHPGDNGIGSMFYGGLGALMGSTKSGCILVMPAFRGETAELSGTSIPSDTTQASPWDRDVDDGLALLQAVLDRFPQADASRISAVGYSRGAGVALLSALRDHRITSVYEIAGPTDFFATSIQNLSKGLALGMTFDLPGVDVIEARYLAPFRKGTISADSLRTVLLARSAARLAISGLLPSTTAVHGTNDSTVFPDQSVALKTADARVDYQSVAGMTHSSFVLGKDQPTVARSLQAFLKAKFGLN